MDLHTDGNAIAGVLQEVFVAEVTTMDRVCQSCGDRNATGAHRCYGGAGLVLRCPTCGDIALRVATIDGHRVFELRGTWAATSPGPST